MILAAILLSVMQAPPPNAAGARSPLPSGEEVGSAYGEFLYRQVCPDPDHCDNALWGRQPNVAGASQAECAPVRRRGLVRCEFLVREQVYLGEILHPCAGLLRRNGAEWTMISLLRPCWPRAPDRPSR